MKPTTPTQMPVPPILQPTQPIAQIPTPENVLKQSNPTQPIQKAKIVQPKKAVVPTQPIQPVVQQPQVPQDNSGGLDPKIVKVMRAIRQVESGGAKDPYTVKGDKGSSMGAFQWNNGGKPLKDGELPKNWKRDAKETLGDENAPMTRANQNQVTYKKIEKWKNEGRGPEEIAAKWNGARKLKDGTYTYVNPKYGVKFRNALGVQAPIQAQAENTAPVPAQPQTQNGTAIQTDEIVRRLPNGMVDTKGEIERDKETTRLLKEKQYHGIKIKLIQVSYKTLL